MTKDDAPPRRWTLRWQDHLPVILTGLLFTMFLVKVAAVAHGDQTTSLAILQRTSPAVVLFGLGALVGMWCLLGLGGSAIVTAVAQGRRDSEFKGRTQVAVVGYAALVAMLTSAVIALAGAIMLSAWLWWPGRHPIEPASQSERLPNFFPMIFVWLVVLSLTATDSVWLPREALTLRGEEPIVGYVLDSDDSSLVVLHDGSRTVERVNAHAIVDREYCDVGANTWWERPLTAIAISGRPNYSDCPH